LRHTKAIEKRVWRHAMERELQSWSHTHENHELWSWSWSLVHEKKSSGAGVVSLYDGSTVLVYISLNI